MNSVLRDNQGNILNPKIPRYEKVSHTQVLWTNPNLTSSFAGQTITLSSANYTHYEVEYYDWLGDKKTMTSGKIPKGSGTNLTTIILPSGSTSIYTSRRNVGYTSDTKLNFSDCASQPVGATTWGVLNNHCIPIKILGYK